MVDPHLYLFLDDAEIDARHRVVRRISPMRRESLEPVVTGDRPWEGPRLATGVALRAPYSGRLRMWYPANPNPEVSGNICYAESDDGMAWTKPDLDIRTWENHSHTNLLLQPWDGHLGNLNVIHNPIPTGTDDVWIATAQTGTWLYGEDPVRTHTTAGSYRLTSPDGLRWTVDRPAVLPRQGDRTATVWDPHRQCFLLTTRHLDWIDEAVTGVAGLRRDVDAWLSDDLLTWHHAGRLLSPDDLDPAGTEFYSLCPVAYGRGYVGLLEVYDRPSGRLSMQLAWSADGAHWVRVGDRSPLLLPGGESAWDSHWVSLFLSPPVACDDRLLSWYSGGSTFHNSGIGHRRAIGATSLRIDGFAALEADLHGGTVTTVRLPAGSPHRVEVNADTRTGELTVEVLDLRGQPIEGFGSDDCRLDETGVRRAVSWRGGDVVPTQPDGIARLRFSLRRASLYAYRWVPAA
jgi:hypothetical protein